MEQESTAGYIYVMYNEMFGFYGEDVYKIGKTNNIGSRVASYTTSYITPVEVKYISPLASDYSLAERAVFQRLDGVRIARRREFFKVNVAEAVEIIEEIVASINNGTFVEVVEEKTSRNDTKHWTMEDKTAIVKEVISKLGFDSFHDTRKINIETLRTNFFNVASSTLIDMRQIKDMFKIQQNSRITEDLTNKQLLGFINSILRDSAVAVRCTTKSFREKGKVKQKYCYKLQPIHS